MAWGRRADPSRLLQIPAIPGPCLHFTPCFAMLRSGSPLGPFESIANTMHLGFRVSSRGALGHSWCFLGSPGLSLGHPWCILGFPGLSLEPLWGLPGDSLEPLWGLLGSPGDSQVTPWVLPVTPPGLPGTLPGLPVDSRGSPGTPRGPLGLSRDFLGTPGVSPGTPRGLSGDSLGTLRGSPGKSLSHSLFFCGFLSWR